MRSPRSRSSGDEPDRNTDAAIASILAQQSADGSWWLGGIARPPIEDGDIFRTALAMSVLKSYGPPGRAAEISRRMSLRGALARAGHGNDRRGSQHAAARAAVRGR